MRVDTLYMDVEEFEQLYYEGAGALGENPIGTLRTFIDTAKYVHQKANGLGEKLSPGHELSPKFNVRVHITFEVEAG